MTTKHPYIKLFARDWLTDLAIRECSAEAQCVWFNMVLLMTVSSRHGFFCNESGEPMGFGQLSRLCNLSPKRTEAAVAELEKHGVFSRDDHGVIFSRRMVRDYAKAEQGREAVGRRWGKPRKLSVVGGTDTAEPIRSKPAAPTRSPNTHSHSQESEEENLPPIPPYPGEIPREGVAAVASAPRPRPGGRVQRSRDWERELVHWSEHTCPRTGEVKRERVCGPVLWDYAVEHTRAILGWPETLQVDWEPLARWCSAGLEWEPDIEPELRAGAAWVKSPITSLRFFEKAMQVRLANKAAEEHRRKVERERRKKLEASLKPVEVDPDIRASGF